MNQRQMREKRQPVSAAKWAAKESSGGRTAFRIPEGMGLLRISDAGTYKLDFHCYLVGKGNPDADEGMIYFERTYYCHAGIGPNNATYICPAKTSNKPCPICEERDRIWKDHTLSKDQKIEQTKPHKVKERQLWLVTNVTNDEEKSKGVQIWDQSVHTFGKFLKKEIQNREDGEDIEMFADPDDGYTLRIIGTKEPTGSGGEFLQFSSIKFVKRNKPLDYDFKEMPCLDDLLIIPTYEQLKKIFFGDEEEVDDTNGEVESKNHRTPAKSSKPSEDEDDEDEDEDDEEEKAPPKKRVAKQPEPEDSEDDEDDEVKLPAWCEEGASVVYKGKNCEITRISRDGKTLTIEDDDQESFRVSPKDCKPASEVPSKKSSPKDEDEDEDEKPRKRRK